MNKIIEKTWTKDGKEITTSVLIQPYRLGRLGSTGLTESLQGDIQMNKAGWKLKLSKTLNQQDD